MIKLVPISFLGLVTDDFNHLKVIYWSKDECENSYLS